MRKFIVRTKEKERVESTSKWKLNKMFKELIFRGRKIQFLSRS